MEEGGRGSTGQSSEINSAPAGGWTWGEREKNCGGARTGTGFESESTRAALGRAVVGWGSPGTYPRVVPPRASGAQRDSVASPPPRSRQIDGSLALAFPRQRSPPCTATYEYLISVAA